MNFLILIVAVAALLMPSALAQTACDEDRPDPTMDSFVCRCDATYCDFPGIISPPADQTTFTRVRSSRDAYRFDVTSGTIEQTATSDIFVHLNNDEHYQTMIGFGGAFTDSTGYNVRKLSAAAQDNFIKSYFAPEGIQYDICRIPIAGSDFSLRPYSYDDVEDDINLTFFNLTSEDYDYKFPLIHAAQAVTEREILFMGSPWSPPVWMKDSGTFNGSGGLKDGMNDPFSNYMVKFIEEYEREGVPIWGITPENEPLADNWSFNMCHFTETEMRDYIAYSLGPILTAANLRRVQLLIHDFNRDSLPWYPFTTLENAEANQYVDGVAIHWYSDNVDADVLDTVHSHFPDKFLLYTEACEGWMDHKVNLGDWSRAENIANDILEDINHHSTGWIDWNMALDLIGGPNWSGNFVDAPVIVDYDNDQFYKQPMFYAEGHFSKFILPGSARIWTGIDVEYKDDLSAATVETLDGTTVFTILNKSDFSMPISVETGDGRFINLDMDPKSIETLIIRTL